MQDDKKEVCTGFLTTCLIAFSLLTGSSVSLACINFGYKYDVSSGSGNLRKKAFKRLETILTSFQRGSLIRSSSMPWLTKSVRTLTEALFPGTRYIPTESKPLLSTIWMQSSTSKGMCWKSWIIIIVSIVILDYNTIFWHFKKLSHKKHNILINIAIKYKEKTFTQCVCTMITKLEILKFS